MSIEIGSKAPNLILSDWVQGLPTNIDEMIGNVIVVEVFQVNCPGCFLYGLPQAVNLYEKFKDKEVKVIGVATAFEYIVVPYRLNSWQLLQRRLPHHKSIYYFEQKILRGQLES